MLCVFIIQLPACDVLPEEQKELLKLERGGKREGDQGGWDEMRQDKVQREQVCLDRKQKESLENLQSEKY